MHAMAGFKVIDAPCCKTVDNLTCIPFRSACKNRNEYRFWDEFHTAEAMNRFVGQSTGLGLFCSFIYYKL